MAHGQVRRALFVLHRFCSFHSHQLSNFIHYSCILCRGGSELGNTMHGEYSISLFLFVLITNLLTHPHLSPIHRSPRHAASGTIVVLFCFAFCWMPLTLFSFQLPIERRHPQDHVSPFVFLLGFESLFFNTHAISFSSTFHRVGHYTFYRYESFADDVSLCCSFCSRFPPLYSFF